MSSPVRNRTPERLSPLHDDDFTNISGRVSEELLESMMRLAVCHESEQVIPMVKEFIQEDGNINDQHLLADKVPLLQEQGLV